MIKLERWAVMNLDGAIRGARNPMNSWAKSDSRWEGDTFVLGPNDLDLARRLTNGGSDDRKFIRQIFVTVDITAPLYWWKEFDTYKVGTVANSCSTMHKIHANPFTRDDFSHDRLDEAGIAMLDATVAYLEKERQLYMEDRENRQHWHNMIQMLPSSYNQMRTVTMNYENLVNMYYARRAHKLAEWHTYCDWIMSLPYAEQLIKVKKEAEPTA